VESIVFIVLLVTEPWILCSRPLHCIVAIRGVHLPHNTTRKFVKKSCDLWNKVKTEAKSPKNFW